MMGDDRGQAAGNSAPSAGGPLLTAGLDMLSEGFGVFDADLKLIACNRQFRILRGYSEDLCRVGIGLDVLLRHNAERGDYGAGDVEDQVASRLEPIARFEAQRFERELADGRRVLIRYEPFSGGGLLVSFSDVTETRRAEQALRRSEERYALALEAINEGVYDWDLAANEVYYSPRVQAAMGLSSKELRTPEDWYARIHPRDAQIYRDTLIAHFKGETDRLECEYRYRAKDGEWRWARQHGLALRNKEGRAYRMIGSTGDITAQKELAQALDRARTRLTEAIESIDEGFLLCDAGDRVLLCNSKYRRIFTDAEGRDLSGVVTLGRPFPEMIRDAYDRGMFREDPDGIEAWLDRRFAAHRNPKGPIELQLESGTWLHISERKTQDGGTVGVYADITELKRREAEIAEKSAILEATLEHMDQGISMVNAELNVIAFNQKFLELLEFPPDRFKLGFHMSQAFRYNALRGEYGDGDVEEQIRQRVEISKRFEAHHFERARPDGTVIEIRGNPLPHRAGFVTTYTDVTKRKRAEEDLLVAKEAAEQALSDLRQAQNSLVQAEKLASLGQLTAGIAHEIKNPLNFVNNFAELSGELIEELREGLDGCLAALGDGREDIEELLEMLGTNLGKIRQHGERADRIVKSMLLHSREGPGERQPVDFNVLIEDSLNLAYHSARAENSNFNITLERDLDPAVGVLDLFQQDMSRVFLNIIGNGIYAMQKREDEDGGAGYRPELKVSTRDLGEWIEARVRDNGPGIPDDVRDKVFSPFFTTKPAGEGTGLGLSLSYDIVVQQHGGQLEVDSEPAAFTEFIIRLPRQAPPALPSQDGDRA